MTEPRGLALPTGYTDLLGLNWGRGSLIGSVFQRTNDVVHPVGSTG